MAYNIPCHKRTRNILIQVAAALFFSTLLIAPPSGANQALDAKLIEVVVTGIGDSKDSALSNAYTNAVQQALGLFVDAETLVKNDEIVRDQILSYSRGFVTESKLIAERDLGALIEVRVVCKVRQQALLEKAQASNISITKVEGEHLHAKVASTVAQEDAAILLVREALKPFTDFTLHRADLIGEPEIVDKRKATLMYRTRFRIDLGEYQKAVGYLKEILEQVALRKEDFSVKIDTVNKAQGFSRTPWKADEALRTKSFRIAPAEKDEVTLMAMTWWNTDLTMSRWTSYYLPKAVLDYKQLPMVGKAEAEITLELTGDSEADLVGLTSAKAGRTPIISPIIHYRHGSKRQDPEYLVSPFFFTSHSNWNNHFREIFTNLKVDVSSANLVRLKTATVTVASPAGQPPVNYLR